MHFFMSTSSSVDQKTLPRPPLESCGGADDLTGLARIDQHQRSANPPASTSTAGTTVCGCDATAPRPAARLASGCRWRPRHPEHQSVGAAEQQPGRLDVRQGRCRQRQQQQGDQHQFDDRNVMSARMTVSMVRFSGGWGPSGCVIAARAPPTRPRERDGPGTRPWPGAPQPRLPTGRKQNSSGNTPSSTAARDHRVSRCRVDADGDAEAYWPSQPAHPYGTLHEEVEAFCSRARARQQGQDQAAESRRIPAEGVDDQQHP